MTSIVKPAEAPKWMTGILRQINNKFAAVTPTAGTVNIPIYKGTVTYGQYVLEPLSDGTLPVLYVDTPNDPQAAAGGDYYTMGCQSTWTYQLPNASDYPSSLAALRLDVSPAPAVADPRLKPLFFMLFSDGVEWRAISAPILDQSASDYPAFSSDGFGRTVTWPLS